MAHLTEELPTFAFKCNTKNKRTYLEMISFVTATENAEVLQGSDTLGAETVFNHSRITPEIKRCILYCKLCCRVVRNVVVQALYIRYSVIIFKNIYVWT